MPGPGPAGVPASGTPASGAPASGTPAYGTPAYGTPAFGTPPFGGPVVSAPGSGPGPRPEYLAAFAAEGARAVGGRDRREGADGRNGEAAGPGRAPGGHAGTAPGPRSASPAPSGSASASASGFAAGGAAAGPGVPAATGVPAPTRGARRDGDGGGADAGPTAGEPAGAAARTPRKGGKARMLTGAAAAAVTTALAVVIAGQVADQQRDGSAPQARGGDDRADGGAEAATRSQTRSGQDAKPADYVTQMAQVFPLDPQLTASGRFRPVGGDAAAPGHGTVKRYRVDVEEGLPLDGELFAEAVHKTLNDDRSWAHGGRYAFQRVASGDADFVISLASPGTTAKWCAKSGLDTTQDNVSCDSAATERVMINAYRWAQGAQTYGPDKMLAYRQMLINHEVGHRLGHNHAICSRQGAPAPVMMQQTKFLTTDGVTCRPNSWPYPTGQ
ncbi:DUF3152 domain-containing protein [Streptomyces rhizoryzae]|uniref:DUF3152 domain-containing protein n=1 Tax=Streptomyces rhizoryzae TaxID=2932493 RepID=UPI003FD81DF3